jgi:hypothetical protein
MFPDVSEKHVASSHFTRTVEATRSSETTVRFTRLRDIVSKKSFTFVMFAALGMNPAALFYRKKNLSCAGRLQHCHRVVTGEYRNLNSFLP